MAITNPIGIACKIVATIPIDYLFVISFPFTKIIGNVGAKMKWFGFVICHLLNKRENHINRSTDFYCMHRIFIFAKIKIDSCFAIEAGV